MRSKSLSQVGIAFVALSLTAVPATALKQKPGRLLNPLFFQAPECSARPDFMAEARTEIPGGLQALPKAVLVARDAEMWVEGQSSAGKDVRVHTYQSFVQEKTRATAKVLCGSTPMDFSNRYSLVAPTLIDVSRDQRVGNSMWQFQVIAEHKGFSAWNKKSPSLSQNEKLEGLMRQMKTNYRVYQLSHNEYELLLQKEEGGVVQTLSIRYEALR